MFKLSTILSTGSTARRWAFGCGLLLVCVAVLCVVVALVLFALETASVPPPIPNNARDVGATSITALMAAAISRLTFAEYWGWLLGIIPALIIGYHALYLSWIKKATLPSGPPPSYRDDRPHGVRPERAQATLGRAYRQAVAEGDSYFAASTLAIGYGIPAAISAVVGIVAFHVLCKPPICCSAFVQPVKDGMIYGGAGAYIYVLLFLGQRNFRHDISTGAATWCAIQLAIGPVLGAAVAQFWQVLGTGTADQQTGATMSTAAACFLAGLAPRQAAAAAQALARRMWAGSTITAAPRTTPLNQVRGITPEVEDRLAEEGVGDAFSLAMANPVRLLRNTPYDKRQILACIDEAILIATLPDTWQALEAEGITGAVDLAYYADDNTDDEVASSISAALQDLATRAKIAPEALREICNRMFEDAQVQLVWTMYQDAGDESSDEETGEDDDEDSSSTPNAKENRVIDHSAMKLGKHPARRDDRTLQMASYLHVEQLPRIPAEYSWAGKVSKWPMMKNDTVGDCTCAAAGHLIEEWTADVGAVFVPTDDQIIAAYSAITGYNPTTGANDNGANELDVLNYWRKTGIADRKIQAYVALEPRNRNHVLAAVYLFGGCYIGVQLPLSAQKQRVWAVPPEGPTGRGAPNSWGGHAVPVVAYDDHGLTVVTWGALKRMTWSFWETYCDEAYAILSPDFLKAGKSPLGFDIAALEEDLKQVSG